MYMLITASMLLSLSAYFNLFATLWFIAGGLFGFVNLYFLKKLLHELIIVNPKNFSKIGLLAIIKFPLLYGISFGLLYLQSEISWTLIAGFIVVLALTIKKIVSDALTSDESQVA